MARLLQKKKKKKQRQTLLFPSWIDVQIKSSGD